MPETSPASLLLRAADFAACKHRAQRRKDGDAPYINHPLAVARRLVVIGEVDDPVTLAAALLHDTIEDTDTTAAEIAREFGDAVASVVVEVTDDTSLPKDARKRGQIAHAPHLSVPARLVKLGDKLDNLDGLTRSAPRGWGPDRVRGYFAWASAVVAGLRGVNVALEASLDEVFGRQVTVDGVSFRAISLDPDERTRVLDAYLAEMAKSVD